MLPIPSKHLKDLFALFAHTIKKDLPALFHDLMTPQELRSLAERWQILKALQKGKTQRTIARELKTSIGKVTRGSRVLQFGKMNYK